MNVYEATQKRLSFLFSEFDRIVVSFSGGKDSGVMLEMVLNHAHRADQLRKVEIYHMDYEAQYQETTDYVTRTFKRIPTEIKCWWICLPIKAQCATSMFQNYWQPWKLSEKKIWCRELPRAECVISERNFPFSFDYEISDYDFTKKFSKELAKDRKTCFLVGIRTQESLHRYKAVNKVDDRNEYKSRKYTTVSETGCVNAYPIYDWDVEDIWTAYAKFGWDYNRLYDLMYRAGLTLNQMRVASPFNDCATASLKLYKAIDPTNWGKLIGRVNGVNFAGLYGGTTAMGWNNIKKPDHFTWKEYMYFLLETLPEETRENYLQKLKVSFAYWIEKGGALPVDTVRELDPSIGFENLGEPDNKRKYSRKYQVLRFHEYLDEVSIRNPNLLPTYKRMCIAIMKNDTSCKTLGFGTTKAEMARRKAVMEKYRNL